jgi:hypothetical protein
MNEKEEGRKKGFFSRIMKEKESGCGCCGGIKIVPKDSSTEKKDPEKKKES